MPLNQTTALTGEQKLSYRDRGYCFPLRVLSEPETARFRSRFLNYLDNTHGQAAAELPRNRSAIFKELHMSLPWVYQLVSHPHVLDAVESVLGPNLLVWGSQWFPKMPGDKAYVSWHQDATYWGLHPPNITTAWIALSESAPENGGMRVIPGTHKNPLLPQRDTYAPDNVLSRGQEIAVEVDEAQAVDIILQPGEMSLHHVAIVHGSNANTSDKARIGLAVRYITPDVVQDGPARGMTMLVRGKDDFGHFDLVEPPQSDEASGESGVRAEALKRKTQNIMPKNEAPSPKP